MSITYHLATEADIEILVEYRIRFMNDFWGEQAQEITDELRKNLSAYYSKATAAQSHIGWFAKDGDSVVAIGGILVREQPGNFKVPSGKVGYIINMYTVPEYRRKGISNTILNKLLESGKAAGIAAFELHATKAGEPLYIKNGFHIHSEPTYRMLVTKPNE